MITNYPITNGFLNDIDRFVNHALGAASPLSCSDNKCSVEEKRDNENGSETPLGWNLRFELPGFKKDEVKLHADEEFLNVTAVTEDEARSFLGKVKRRVRISEEVDTEKISAKLEDGILYLEIPRKVKAEPKTIVID
ncbi:MAG: Hsp20/alpha crystallin family protein [Akkermansiaceae bacterium]